MKSLSEIDTISKRASRAVGFSWGVAEEVGKSIRILELFGFEGIKTNGNTKNILQKNDLSDQKLALICIYLKEPICIS